MEEEVIVTEHPVTVDPQTAQDRGDNFTPTPDDEPAAAPADEPEQAADPATPPTDPEAADKGSPMIPKARLNEVIGERNAERTRNAELEAELAEWRAGKRAPGAAPAAPAAEPAPAFDIAEREGAYMEAVLAGNRQEAAKIRATINQHLIDTATQSAEMVLTARQERDAMQAVEADAYKDYPYLKTDEGALAVDLILGAQARYVQAHGMPAHLALKKAVTEIAPKFAPADGQPPSKDLPEKGNPDNRTQAAIQRGATDSLAQPPVPAAGIGNRATQARVDVKQLTDEQFEQLPESEKRRLRGD